jgi:hypothetical protein
MKHIWGFLAFLGLLGVISVGASVTGACHAPPPPPTVAFYVSPSGSDSNPGTLASPFLTLGQCQSAMRNSPSIKTCTLRGGTYSLTATLVLTSADNGETWEYYPADGVDSPILDGGGSIATAMEVEGNNITINGLTVQHFTLFHLAVHGATGAPVTGNTIENNLVENLQGSALVENLGNSPDCINVADATGTTVSHNACIGSPGAGIIAIAYNSGDTVNNTLITANVILNFCNGGGGGTSAAADCGGIYVNMHASGDSGRAVTISNNFVRDGGIAGMGVGGCCGASLMDVYLDDEASNVTVSGNVLGPNAVGSIKSSPYNNNNSANLFNNNDGVAGNGNNTFTGNILDTGSSSLFAVAYVFGASDIVEHNIVLFGYTGSLGACSGGTCGYAYLTGTPVTVTQNGYANSVGGSVFYHGLENAGGTGNGSSFNDSDPTTYASCSALGLSGYLYTLASNSPAYSAPVSFPAIVGGWGPPGYTIPTSTNHSCP